MRGPLTGGSQYYEIVYGIIFFCYLNRNGTVLRVSSAQKMAQCKDDRASSIPAFEILRSLLSFPVCAGEKSDPVHAESALDHRF